jgi:AAA domain
VFLVLSGSSASGKTTLARLVGDRLSDLAVHELAELTTTPWDGDVSAQTWRRRQTERWLRRSRELEAEGVDLLVTEGVLGEVLAAPSAVDVQGIAACLIDCDPFERLRRLHDRGDHAFDAEQLWHFCAWGLWLRMHSDDPRAFAGPIRGEEAGGWEWSRWDRWDRDDPRWDVFVLDTTAETVERSAERLAGWVGEQRRLLAAGRLPLSGRWWDAP